MTISTFYRVDIAASGLGGAAPDDGFIDNKKIETYMAEGSNPTTVTQTLAKERANLRFERVREQLGLLGNCYLRSLVATGANATSAATTFSFTVECERGDQFLATYDELNEGEVLTGAEALERSIARALVTDFTDKTEYHDPTKASTAGNAMAYNRNSHRIETITVGALSNSIATVESGITIEKITDI